MLLRASSEALGEEADLGGAVGRGAGGVLHGDLLASFAELATRGGDNLPDVRAALIAAVGPEAFVDAAATVGIFNGLVRVADATGIPLDKGTLDASADFRSTLGLNEYAGARSSDLGAAEPGERPRNVEGLFGF